MDRIYRINRIKAKTNPRFEAFAFDLIL